MSVSSQRFLVSAVLIVAIVLAAIGGIVWHWRPAADDDAFQTLNRGPNDREAARLVAIKNAAVALLENGDLNQADPLFLEIVTGAHGEPVGTRNLVITRLRALEEIHRETAGADADSRGLVDASGRARTALGFESVVESRGGIRHYLAARIAFFTDDVERRLASLHAAAGNAPDDPRIWHELYLAERDDPRESVRTDGENALNKVVEVAPDNLAAILEWIAVQARRRDAAIRQTLARAHDLLKPFAIEMVDDQGTDVLRRISEADAAAEQGDWPSVDRTVPLIEKIRSRHPAVRFDRKRLDAGVLDYVVHDFSDSFYRDRRLDGVLATQPAAVTYRESPDAGPIADLSDVRDVAFVDFDGDGKLDVSVLRSSSFEIYTRPDSTGHWRKMATTSLAPPGFERFQAVDLDGEAPPAKPVAGSLPRLSGDPEVLLFGPNGVVILATRLQADGKTKTLQPVEGLKIAAKTKGAVAVVPVDLDGDGDRDLVVCRRGASDANAFSVWINRGHLRFDDVTDRTDFGPSPVHTGAMVGVDWNHDRDADILVGGVPSGAGLFRGRGFGRFRFHAIDVAAKAFPSATSLEAFDADGNGSWDLLAGGPSGISLFRTRIDSKGETVALQTETVADFPTTRLLLLDYDNDGIQDFAAWNGESVRCFHGITDGRFEPVHNLIPAALQAVASGDCGDFDGDGDTDLVFAVSDGTSSRLRFLRNDGGNANNWIDVCLQPAQSSGVEGARQNRGTPTGVGCQVELTIGTVRQMRTPRGPTTHFGIGTSDSADVLRIVWSNGVASNVICPEKNRTVFARPAPPVFEIDDKARAK